MRRENVWPEVFCLFTVALIAQACLGGARAQEISAGSPVVVTGKFTAPSSNKDGKPRGISGMACLAPAANGSRECFAVNDEERFGEVATLTANELRPTGAIVTFVAKDDTGQGVVGIARNPMCRDKNGAVDDKPKFGELDGEGVATADGYIYTASSHSCSGKGKYKPSSYLLTRFRTVDDQHLLRSTAPAVERSWRLADALLNSTVKDAYGQAKTTGTNIEGIAVINGRLYAGLRTPVTDRATIVSAPVEGLFASSNKALDAASVQSIPLDLGKDTGVRDLAALTDGRLLVLSGPTIEQDTVDYKLWLIEKPLSEGKRVPLAILAPMKAPSGERAKAETVTIISEAPKLEVLVLYDNIDEGSPMRHELLLPKDTSGLK